MSTEPPAAPEAAPEPQAAPEAQADPAACLPGFVRKLGGFEAAWTALEVARKAKKLPTLNPVDYRFILGRPGGNPFSFPVQVVYRPGTPKEKDLGTFRIGR